MKIDRLYTLSEFLNMQPLLISERTGISKPEHISSKNIDIYNTESLYAYGRIQRYNDFLKQPLAKDMFINEIEHPSLQYSDPIHYESEMHEYLDAQKKVIFIEFKAVCVHNCAWSVCNGDHTVTVYDDWFIAYINNDTPNSLKTIHDLAEATKGQLKLKNFIL